MPFRALALALLPLVACVPLAASPVTQHGLIAAPRAPTYDGQAMPTALRVEGHFSTARIDDLGGVADSGAAVARHQAGGALRAALNATTDFGIESDVAWSASKSTLSGDSSISAGVPEAAVIDAALALRTSLGTGPLHVGLALALGLSSSPIHRSGQPDGIYSRDEAALVRAAVVPSYRFDNITLYASIGGATQSDVKETFTWYPDNASGSDPGVIVETSQFVLTAAAGATVDLGDRAHLTAQIGDALGRDAHFGPQLMGVIAMDLGAAPPR